MFKVNIYFSYTLHLGLSFLSNQVYLVMHYGTMILHCKAAEWAIGHYHHGNYQSRQLRT